MKSEFRIVMILFVSIALCLPAAAGDRDLRKALTTGNVETVRVNLNPWGPHLGFEMEIGGDEPGVAALLSVIATAEPSQGHKCANRGAIRFRMAGGDLIAVGLLPSHGEGSYQYRLYDGDHLEGVFIVQRGLLLDSLEGLGVPIDDPAFAD